MHARLTLTVVVAAYLIHNYRATHDTVDVYTFFLLLDQGYRREDTLFAYCTGNEPMARVRSYLTDEHNTCIIRRFVWCRVSKPFHVFKSQNSKSTLLSMDT